MVGRVLSITKIENAYNYELSPKNTRFFRCYWAINDSVKRQLDINNKSAKIFKLLLLTLTDLWIFHSLIIMHEIILIKGLDTLKLAKEVLMYFKVILREYRIRMKNDEFICWWIWTMMKDYIMFFEPMDVVD